MKQVLDSRANRRLVVAGPGTGKSHLFEAEVAKHDNKPLLMSFLRALVEEMGVRLGSQALVRTFHSFCKREFLILHAGKHPEFQFHYPSVGILIEDDLKLTGLVPRAQSVTKEVDRAMQSRVDHPLLERWLEVAERYQAYGHTDLIYRVLDCIDAGDTLPKYPMVIVDEYQDFSALEREFIARLADESPILIVGDDDQALYDFKGAGPDGIRELHSSGNGQVFPLPYCSRCPPVVVDALQTLVARAEENGLLDGRIDKPFVCYTPDKEADGEKYPKMIHAACTVHTKNAPYIARYIEGQVRDICSSEIEASWKEGYPTVLVIGPDPFRSQVYKHLTQQLPNVSAKTSAEPAVERADAIRILAQDTEADLGWRIVCHTWPGLDEFVKQYHSGENSLRSLLPKKVIDEILVLVEIGRCFTNGEPIDDSAAELFINAVGQSLDSVFPGNAGIAEPDEEGVEEPANEDRTRPRVLCTSFQGSKGLSADHVFLVGMSEGHFPSNDPTDNEVMCLLVGITRTRKCCHFVSCRSFAGKWLRPSRFIDWIADHVICRKVDKAYFSERQ